MIQFLSLRDIVKVSDLFGCDELFAMISGGAK